MAQPMADTLAAAAVAGTPQAAYRDVLINYGRAAFYAAAGCVIAAHSGQWEQWPAARNDLFRALTAAKLVLLAGRQLLEAERALRAAEAAEAAEERRCSGGSVSQEAEVEPNWLETPRTQLEIMHAVLRDIAPAASPPTLAAAAASAVAPPQLLVPWLASISHALQECSPLCESGKPRAVGVVDRALHAALHLHASMQAVRQADQAAARAASVLGD